MPEGHSVHRIARQFAANFVGRVVAASSPQGRFAEGASLLDGRTMSESRAVGKQLFLGFDEVWLRVHLGMYGAWDFAGDIRSDPALRAAGGTSSGQGGSVDDRDGEDSVSSIGAPRRSRLRMAEQETAGTIEVFPPPPVGAVRVRLLTDSVVADLRGPTACEITDGAGVAAVVARLGPDPLVDDVVQGRRRFIDAVLARRTPIGLLLMDQSIVSGIGNVYRAELLFRARLDPHVPGNRTPPEVAGALWDDWAHLLRAGVRIGQMMTMDDLEPDAWRRAMSSRDDRHWVYKRQGLPCRVCSTHILMEEMGARKLYWCPVCQS